LMKKLNLALAETKATTVKPKRRSTRKTTKTAKAE